MSDSAAMRAAYLAVLAFLVAACRAPEPGTVRVRVVGVDDAPLPSFVAFQNLDSGEWIKAPQPFLANQQEDKRSRRPQWRGQQPIHCDGSAEVGLPAGRYRVVAGKGVEFEPATAEIEVVAHQAVDVRLGLRRWIDLPAQGWWSGDTHVHITRDRRELNRPILLAAQAEDIHVSNLLEMGDIETVVWPQYAWGEEGVARDGDYWLTVGQEEPRTHQVGHAVVLDIPHLLRDTEHYYLYDRIFRQGRELGGLTGMAHFVQGKFHSERSADLLFPQGLIDFVELLDNNNKLRPQSFYDALNLGFRPVAVAGSDYPWGSHPGDQRVFVYVDPSQPFSLDRWFDGIRSGRTFVTQGPLLEFEVNGRPIGSTLSLARGDRIAVRARARGHREIGSPRRLAIVSMGEEIKLAESADPGREELAIEFEMEVKESQWLALTAEAHNGAAAHTSAVYVEADGKPVRAEGAAFEWAIERAIERLGTIKDPEFLEPGAQRDDFVEQVERALAYYRERKSQSR